MGGRFLRLALVRLFLLGLITLITARASAVEPGQEAFLTHAVWAEQRLWVLSDAGDLSSIAGPGFRGPAWDGQDTRRAEVLPEPVLSLCKHGGHPLILTGSEVNSAWTLRQRGDVSWQDAATIEREGDGLLAMDCAADRITLLTTRRLISLVGAERSTVALSGTLTGGLINATYATPDQFFVGINRGEWGGGLRRIDRRTGEVTVVERNASGALCGGPLNTQCDPVTGIVALPWKPDCVAVAIGLVHFTPRGRVVEVCGDEVRPLYYKEYSANIPSGALSPKDVSREDGEPFETVAFFGLTLLGETLWAVGIDGIYRIEADGTAHVMSLPPFEDIGGVRVSFQLMGMIPVLTQVNQRQSMSGATPLLAQMW
jgi:hypothetical protein